MLSVCVIICPQKELLSVRAELKSVREVSVPCWTAVLCVLWIRVSLALLFHIPSLALFILSPLLRDLWRSTGAGQEVR